MGTYYTPGKDRVLVRREELYVNGMGIESFVGEPSMRA
jgi:hypothetical protein